MRILLFALLVIPVSAATYTVKAGGNGDYTTIQACATAMANGDTCAVYSGTYNENVTVSAGGVGAYKTITVNGSDVATVQSFTLNSHTKLIGNCPTPTPGAAPAAGSCGFTVTYPSSPNSRTCVALGNGATDVYIRNNVITQCGNQEQVGANYTNAVSYVYIQGNTLSYACATPANITTSKACDSIYLTGHHFLIENNDLSHYTLGYYHNASYSVFRNNIMHDQYETEGAGNAHTDFWFSEPGNSSYPAQYNVIEGNYHHNAFGPNAKGVLSQTDGCGTACFNLIQRFNTTSREDGGPVANNSINPGWNRHKIYNNTRVDTNYTFYNSGGGAIGDNSTSNGAQGSGAANAAHLNNIFYYTNTAEGAFSGFNAYACDDTLGCNYGYNLLWCASPASCPANTIHNHRYGSGDFTSDPGNKKANPLFVSYVSAGSLSNDYHLLAGSPAIAAGTYLTTVAAGDSGSGTSLIVNDAAYFQDGYGLTNTYSTVSPDCIAVGTAANYVCITSVNYSTNTLTLASSISRTAGQGVYLYSKSDGVQVLTGSAPDMGAYPYGGGAPICSITPTSVGPYVAGQVVSQQFTASNCNSSSFTIVAGSLSGSGLTLSPGGLLSGIAGPGAFSFTVAYGTATDPLTLTITAGSSPASGVISVGAVGSGVIR